MSEQLRQSQLTGSRTRCLVEGHCVPLLRRELWVKLITLLRVQYFFRMSIYSSRELREQRLNPKAK